MKLSISPAQLAAYVARQLNALFPDRELRPADLSAAVDGALARTASCYRGLRAKYFQDDGESVFNHLHTDQYAMFLYFVANSIFRMRGDLGVASRVYALNKALHGIDVFYEVELPSVFCFQHPVGTVLGRARYGEYFFVYQRCSVGSSVAHDYPTLGRGVVMFGGAAVIGKCVVGDNVWLSVNATVVDGVVPSDSIVFGQSPNLVVKPAKRDVIRYLFDRESERAVQ